MAATADALLERLSSAPGRTGLFLVAVGSHGLELSPAARAVASGLGARFGRKVLEVLPPVEAGKGTPVRRRRL